MHRKIQNYLEQHFEIDFPRNSECYYEEPMISFDISKEDFDILKDIQPFELGNARFSRLTEGEHVIEDRRGGKCIYFKIEYLDIDTYHSDITDGNRKKYGAIAPNGKFYECFYEGHYDLEYELKQRGLISGRERHCFEDNGWIKLTGAMFSKCEFEFNFQSTVYDYSTKTDTVLDEFQVTAEQVETMKAYIKSLDRSIVLFHFDWYNVDDLDKLVGLNQNQYYESFHDLHIAKPEDEDDELYKGM